MLIDVSTMTHKSKFDLVTVGHFAIDTINSPIVTPARTTLGGPPTYVSVAAARLGAKVSVISKVGGDFSREHRNWLLSNRVDLSGLKQVKNRVTTHFIIRYQATNERKLQLKTRAPRISVMDIPPSLQAEAIHVAPIANELSTDTIAKLRKTTNTLSLDPQGFVRSFNTLGNMKPRHWAPRSTLELIDVYKSSIDELKMVVATHGVKEAARKIQDYGVKVVIATRGLKGSTLLIDNAFHNVPASKPQVVVDPTGAGDAYIGAFLAEYIEGKDPLWCACVGSAMASFVVEGVGPERFGTKQETYERAGRIYQKDI